MRTHVRLTAAIFLLAGLVFTATAALSPALFTAAASAVLDSGEDGAALASTLLRLTGRTMAIGGAVFAIPCLLCAWGLIRRRPWSRWLAILLAAIALVAIPIGTLAGGYVLWVMLSQRFEPWFEERAGSGTLDHHRPSD